MENLYKVNTAHSSEEKERAGFITFWLWFGIIANVISIPFTILQLSSMSNLGYIGMELIAKGVDISHFNNSINTPVYMMIGVAILSAIFNIWGYASLLKWKKNGFFIIVVGAIISTIVTFISYPMIQDAYSSIDLIVDYSTVQYAALIGAGLSIVILWLILQIKKGNYSYWSQLK